MSQPLEEAYPSPVTPVITRQPDSSHSNGSFGPVFAVLAIIVVISAVACVLGRLCSRRQHRGKEASGHQDKAAKKKSQGLPKEWEPKQQPSFNMKGGDIEFGFDKRNPSQKGGKNGGGKAKTAHHNGGHKQEVRFADNV